MHHDRHALTICLPWLPPDRAIQTPIDDRVIDSALSAFTEASPTARTPYADLLQRLIAQTKPRHLVSLTRLACAMTSEDVWTRGATLVQESPDNAYRVITAAPWDDLAETVRAAILEQSDRSDICGYRRRAGAHGRRTHHERVRRLTLDPNVWNALPSAERRRWLDALREDPGYLVVRSLGPRPEVRAKANLDNDFVHAAQRHIPDAAALRWTMLPVALRNLSPDAASALIAALPTPPPAPSAFSVVASGHADPSVITVAHTTLQTPADLAYAIAVQRCTDFGLTVRASCATLRDILRGRSWNDLALIMAFLSDAARAALFPDREALVERLEFLPLEVAAPTVVALGRRASVESNAATVIADALRAHGEVFMTMGDAIADHAAHGLLPLLEHEALAHALRALADEDPPSARHLAHALRHRGWRDAIRAFLTTSQRHAEAIWRALHPATRRAISTMLRTTEITRRARTFSPWSRSAARWRHARAAALQSNDDVLRRAGVAALAALAARPDILRALWAQAPREILQSLRADSSILVAVADIHAEQSGLPDLSHRIR